MLLLDNRIKDIYGKKCKYKNQICDGLCNNCYACNDGIISTGKNYKSNNYYSFSGNTDYEELILARQESCYD